MTVYEYKVYQRKNPSKEMLLSFYFMYSNTRDFREQ